MVRALAAASFTIEIGPCSPARKTAVVTSSGASVNACHSSSVKADLSVIGAPRSGGGANRIGPVGATAPNWCAEVAK